MFRSVYVTTGSEKEAERIASSVIAEKLAACANLFHIKSIYWWQGKVEKDDEVAMFLKTTAELLPPLMERVKQLHSYEVPCIIALEIQEGNQQYLQWIAQSVQSEE